jgi:hypothetical protein
MQQQQQQQRQQQHWLRLLARWHGSSWLHMACGEDWAGRGELRVARALITCSSSSTG